jgi:hypothetical protein
MTRLPTSAHLAAWAGVVPGNNESGGRQRPALDLMSSDICLGPPDQRGIARPQGAGCDAGAVEFVPPVPSFGDVPPDYWAHDAIARPCR